ncbi:TetR/AcrR family transcriptional regulator [Hamadaea tsunoensis]|uniref:TetR/AcrR family transcriptional regulator n=1 Tax=Hamadaea tsunoensis TaxID=53368 RepID=UPI000410A223|nr:TetR family transcriptional regulator [Hamadaea tsunoensis]
MSETPLRADAARNRELLLDSAVRLFAARGPDAPLEDVAAAAGVGVATLYRRFPTREDLLLAVADRKMDAYEQVLRTAQAIADPWTAFASYVENFCAAQAADGRLADILTMVFPAAREFEARRMALYNGYLALVRDAQAAGALRADYSPEDLPVLLMANAGVLRATAETAPGAWKRFVAYMLQAFCASHQREDLPPAPTPRQMMRSMQQVTACHGRSAPDAR